MASLGPDGKPWGQKGRNRDEHASRIIAEAQQLLTTVAPEGTTKDKLGRQTPKKGKPIAPTVAKAFLATYIFHISVTLLLKVVLTSCLPSQEGNSNVGTLSCTNSQKPQRHYIGYVKCDGLPKCWKEVHI